ncbi:MAG: bifunctional phosphopantothenoylcysteine decarboxylase/phosphopantothenate--cysteine ligase CoaBC [Acidobacteria bacterium]|nr:bifunctional phosphopantothenoylcysteine decarboxylase/phosphopantothenate--cysteine ligase CoaBC [Acidobacteriota bacterium]MBI3263676.1 bifunctional phosphopantothenoylcysteine decarboxylase/phosphopantothenate--cysteine ligase CoaBC [Acidobacteriota bacterium]
MLVALGVCGGIGAYKAVEIARGLQSRGHDVVAIMTRSARKFVGPLTFEAITRRRVITSQFAEGANADIEHISLATAASLLVVAPATANVIGKFANGIADDFLSSLYLAIRAPVLMAPAMNTNMLEHEAVKRNIATLSARGVRFVEPGSGYLACGWIGKGRLAEPDAVVEAAEAMLRPSGPLAGRKVLVTAGPTYEDLDPVRFIGNRSSGKMGFALAAEATARGADVVLVMGPTPLAPPQVSELVRVRRATEMHGAVMQRAPAVEVVIMAAAVADYAPRHSEAEKIAKQADGMVLALERTPDVLADLGQWRAVGGRERPLLVGFAAETSNVDAKAREKLRRKKIDLIVANDVSREGTGFEGDANAVALIAADDEGGGAGAELPALRTKREIAATILDRVEAMLQKPQAAAGTRS